MERMHKELLGKEQNQHNKQQCFNFFQSREITEATTILLTCIHLKSSENLQKFYLMLRNLAQLSHFIHPTRNHGLPMTSEINPTTNGSKLCY
jgi:hypothetical protein